MTLILGLCATASSCDSPTPTAEVGQATSTDYDLLVPPDHSAPVDQSQVARVKVFRDGRTLLDGKQVSIEQLRTSLADLKAKNGVVWYYRENPTDEAPAHALNVWKAILEARLPIRISAKPDYLDWVGSDRQSHPINP